MEITSGFVLFFIFLFCFGVFFLQTEKENISRAEQLIIIYSMFNMLVCMLISYLKNVKHSQTTNKCTSTICEWPFQIIY